MEELPSTEKVAAPKSDGQSGRAADALENADSPRAGSTAVRPQSTSGDHADADDTRPLNDGRKPIE